MGIIELQQDNVRKLIPIRKPNSYKGTYGHAAIIAGSHKYINAGYLCTEAAVRTGAGLITWVLPGGLDCSPPLSAMKKPIGKGNYFIELNSKEVASFIKNTDAFAIGSGLSNSIDTFNFIINVLQSTDKRCVVDADGLNAIAYYKEYDLLDSNCIITPHIGEFSRLIQKDISYISKYPIKAIEYAREFIDATIVLKGHETYITSKGSDIYVSRTGNAGMASGGSGDVLTGIIASLLAQGIKTTDAAKLGAYIHGLAGDLAHNTMSMQSMCPADEVNFFDLVYKKLLSN